jgi:hypothetical protein
MGVVRVDSLQELKHKVVATQKQLESLYLDEHVSVGNAEGPLSMPFSNWRRSRRAQMLTAAAAAAAAAAPSPSPSPAAVSAAAAPALQLTPQRTVFARGLIKVAVTHSLTHCATQPSN